MTNKEKYAKELLDVLCETGKMPAMIKRKITACDDAMCQECRFRSFSHGCDGEFKAWAWKEYKEPEVDWTKVPVDTKILVRNSLDKKWYRRYFYQYEESTGRIYSFALGSTSWTANECDTVMWEYAQIADPDEREKYLKHE